MRAAAGHQVGALWQRGQPWVVLAAGLLLATVGLLLFAVIATQLPEPSTRVAEQVVLGAVRPLRQPALTRVMEGLSALGSPWVLLILAGLAAVPRLVRGDRLAALLLLVVLAGGGLLNLLLKVLFQRPRPVAPEVTAAGYAFPSGHAMLRFASMGFWPTWRRVPPGRRGCAPSRRPPASSSPWPSASAASTWVSTGPPTWRRASSPGRPGWEPVSPRTSGHATTPAAAGEALPPWAGALAAGRTG